MQTAIPTDPKMIEAELRRRGLLATSGNIRMMPFDTGANSNGSNSPASPADGTGSATANALAASNGGGLTVPDVNGNPVVVPPNATTLPANVPDESWMNLLPALAGAGGAALALLIKNHFANKGINVPVATDPAIEGTLEPDTAMRAASDIVDGEFTEVNDPRLTVAAPANDVSATDPRITKQLALPAPPPTLDDKAVDTKPKNLTAAALKARRVAARKAGGVPIEGSGPTLVGNDSYADLTPDEMKQARTIADQLIEQRIKGRQRRYVQGKTDVGRKGLPTLPIDKEGALNIVVRAIRDAKLNPTQVRKAVGR